MKKRVYRTICIALSVFMLCLSLPSGIIAQELQEENPALGVFNDEETVEGDYTSDYEMPGNLNAQNYVRFASPAYSHMFPIEEGYLKIYASDKYIIASKYDSNLKYIEGSGLKIIPELPRYGGFYAGVDGNYYIAYGQDNDFDKRTDENIEKANKNEVIRVVKYDKSFERLGAAHIYGANTTVPFKSGSLRMAQKGKYLYVRTSHRMYPTEKGEKHQANISFEIETQSMELLDIQSEVSNLSEGYVSHSFDQYIIVDDADNIITLDHGDAHPRAIVLGKYGTTAGNTDFTRGGFKYNNVLVIRDKKENEEAVKNGESKYSNASGVALGALDYSATTYLVAGSSVAQDDTWSIDNEFKGRNIFVCIVDRSDISKSKIVWLTKYKTTDEVFASVPQLVKLSDEKFMLLWNEIDTATQKANGKYHYVLIDQNGTKKSDIGNGTGYITDCTPVANADGSVTWFTDNGTKQFFYGVDKDLNAMDPVMDTAKESEFKEIKYDGSQEDKDDSSSSGKKNGDSSSGKNGDSSSKKDKEEKEKEKEEAQHAADMENAAVSENGKFYLVRGSKAYLDGAKKVKKDKTYSVQYTPEKIVKLNSKGYVAGKAEGSCTIKLVSEGKSYTFRVVVVEPEVVKKMYVNKGESMEIPIKAKVLTGANFISSNTDSVEVSEVSGNGVVKAKDGKGAKISYTIGTKKFKTSVVVCSQEIVGKDTIAEGRNLKLKLSGGAPGEIKWESSNSKVASIDEKGVVTAVKKGTVTISATNNGKTVTKKLVVE